MSDRIEFINRHVNRRTFIRATGLTGAAAFAGCSSNSSNSGSGRNASNASESGGNGQQVYDAQQITIENVVPTKMQWNVSNPTSYSPISQHLLFDPFAKYNYAKKELVPYAITDWTFSKKGLKMTLRNGLSWSNGDKITAADVVTQLKIGLHTGAGYGDYTDSIEAPDKKTIQLRFSHPVNHSLAEFQIVANHSIQQPKSVFGKYLDQIEKNEKQGLQKLQSFAWKQPIAGGPFKLSKVSPQQVLLERRSEHPDAHNINFKQYVCRYLGSDQSAPQAMIANRIDSVPILFAPPHILNQLPNNWQQVKTPANYGFGLVPQFKNKYAGDRAVRQAIEYVMNREAIAKNSGPATKTAPKYPVAIPPADQKRILGDAASDFETYGKASSETEKATKVLENAGYSKQGGTWKDSNGGTVELPIQVPSGFSDWVAAANTIADQFNRFGFKSSLDSRSYDTLAGHVWADGDFVLAAGSWLPGGASASIPYFPLSHQMLQNGSGYTYNYPPANSNRGGKNASVTVPSRTGSGTTTVNPAKEIKALTKITDQKKIDKKALTLEWVTNQDLPMIPVIEKQDQAFISNKNWDIPKPGAAISQVKQPATWLVRFGKLQYNGGQ